MDHRSPLAVPSRRRSAEALSAVPVLLLLALLGGRPALAQATCGASSSCSASEHTITFQNSCAYPIWIANAANIVGGSVIGGKTCSTTNDCCVTLADGTLDCAGVNCVNGTCSQINCTKDADCPSSASGLVSCNVPQGVQCSSDANCATFSCTTNSDCPSGATCSSNGVCTGMCQNQVCACSASTGCPGAGTICDTAPGSQFGFCAGGACQYDGLVPENAPGTKTPQWQIAAGKSATVCMPQGWGGRFWGRTGCTLSGSSLTCQTGQCGTGAAAVLECTDLADGISQTAAGVTLFEGTWDSNQTDFWDVSLVNGYNVGMAVTACGSSSSSCLFAGQKVTATGVGCTSDLNASCPSLLSIQGQCNCATNADCPSGETCGTNNLCSGATSCTVACLDPGDLCKGFGLFGNASVLPAPACLSCNSTVPPLSTTTYADFYNCVGPLATVSCNNAAYTCFSDADCPYQGQTCKGNVCWPVNALNALATCTKSGSGYVCNTTVNQVAEYSCQAVQGSQLCLPTAPTASDQGCCGPYNPGWTTAALAAGGTASGSSCQPGSQPYTAAFKAACPGAYSYQFDDPSSSYQCSDSSGEVNYLVTFCPGGTGTAPRPAAPSRGSRGR